MDLVELLGSPPMRCDVETLAALWEIDALRVTAERPEGLEDYPELSIRLRGAFERALAGSPARPTRSGRRRKRAFEALATPLATIGNDEVAKPVVVRAWIDGDRLHCELRLLGFAGAWFDEAADALVAALEHGVALAPNSRIDAPIRVISAESVRLFAPCAPPGATVASIHLRTPLAIRRKSIFSTHAPALIGAAARHARALAPWLGLSPDLDLAMLSEATAAVAFEERDVTHYRSIRHSIRRGDAPMPFGGLLGRLTAHGQIARVTPLLAIASTMNVGSQAAVGLGWFYISKG